MYEYKRRRKIGPVTILFLFLFSVSVIGLLIISYFDRGRFWDIVPYFCIPIIVLSLILSIYNLVRRCSAGFIFILFIIICSAGLVLSSIFGPFALSREAAGYVEENDYSGAVQSYGTILKDYPNSRYSEEALREISFAYYDNDQFPESLESFEDAIGKGFIDQNDPEILDILQDIHYQIAQAYRLDSQYLKSANSYVSSIELLKNIINDFPDTNEAFVARYKIPKYLLEAAGDFNRAGDNSTRITLLEEIVTEYQESDQYQEAIGVISDAYIDCAVELSAESDYEGAVQWFVKYLENTPQYSADSISDFIMDDIFSQAVPSAIKKSADIIFAEKDYAIAAVLYDIIADYNPDYIDSIVDNLVKARISAAAGSQYNEISDLILIRYIDLPGLSLLEITDDTSDQLRVYITGTENHMSAIAAGETVKIEIAPGDYTVLITSENISVLPFMGDISFSEYRKYSGIFKEPDSE